MGEKGVGKLSQETPPPREGEPMGVNVLLNLYCPGHLSYFSPNESEPLIMRQRIVLDP